TVTTPSATAVVANHGWPDDALAPGAVRFMTNLGVTATVHQCFPVTVGRRYLASFHGFVPGGQAPNTGGVSLYVYGFTSTDCSTGSQALVLPPLSVVTYDAWFTQSQTVVVPAGVVAAAVVVRGTKNPGGDGAAFEVLADAVYFGPAVKGDFNSDGYADIVFDNVTDESHRVWTMGGGVRDASSLVTPDAPTSDWKLAVTDDFNDDAMTDLVFRNQSTGAMQFWLMNGLTRGTTSSLAGASPPPVNWTLAAAADFNHDGQPDLLWRDETTQQLVIWTMSATTYVGALIPNPAQAVDANWSVVVAAD